ncbi:MAG: hypothetical protein B6D73_14265 [gamma proteobacterium symbiont of Stewartia floridana]|nr:MAG: hypothetical protein B6D73_14265 [gamma proteobacterium symbiont of Stewartia floridana]
MGDFLDVARHLLSTQKVKDKEEHFKRVFKAIGALQAVHSKSQLDLTNIESIFTAFEISNVLGKLPGFDPNEIPEVIASLKELIVTTLEETITFPTRETLIGVPEPYGEFAKLLKFLTSEAVPQQTTSIITFNYDIAIDMALCKSGLGPDYGIPPDSGDQEPIPLYKLHGSLNWALRKDTGSVHPLQLNQYFREYSAPGNDGSSTCKIKIGSQLKDYFTRYTDVKVEDEPFIVPPTWNKADYHQALSTIWSKAAQHLSEAKSIFIIGYSLPETDAFFRLLYALGTVGPSPLERVVVYNPDKSGGVYERFSGILGPGAKARYQYFTLPFESAILNIEKIFSSTV